MKNRHPSALDIQRATVDAALTRVRTGAPGRIVAYNAAEQSATVQPLLRGRNPSTGEPYDLPAIPKVPLLWPRGGGFRITWPLVAGDVVWLSWSHRSLEHWASEGGMSDTSARRWMNLGDCVAYPGISPNVADQAIADADTQELVLGREGGAEIRIGADVVKLGGAGATEFVALAGLVVAAIEALRTAFNSHTHAGVVVGGGTSAGPLPQADPVGDVAATKVKAE